MADFSFKDPLSLAFLAVLFAAFFFCCVPTTGLCQCVCVRNDGVRSVDVGGGEEFGRCECMDGTRYRIWPWTRPIAWLSEAISG